MFPGILKNAIVVKPESDSIPSGFIFVGVTLQYDKGSARIGQNKFGLEA